MHTMLLLIKREAIHAHMSVQWREKPGKHTPPLQESVASCELQPGALSLSTTNNYQLLCCMNDMSGSTHATLGIN
jgi:hypothetical protein